MAKNVCILSTMKINIETAMKKLKFSKYADLARECGVTGATLSAMKQKDGILSAEASLSLYAKYPAKFKLTKRA